MFKSFSNSGANPEDAEELEALQPSPDETAALVKELKRLRAKEGPRPAEFPDLSLEQQRLAEKNESIFERVKDAIKGAFDFLVVRPAKWIGHQVVDHPVRTLCIALAAFALWYYSAPLSAGLSALKEKGIGITSSLLSDSLKIDPTQVDVYDKLMKLSHGASLTN